MTYPISDVTRRVVYSGSAGVGPYSFTFEILTENDIGVYKNTTLLTITTDYTVTINADGTGSITLTSAASASDTVSIFGNKGIQRQTDFTTGGDLFANSLNDELDSQTIFAQQNSEAISRSLRAPLTDPTTVDMVLPAKDDRKGRVLGFNATTGDPEQGPEIADVESLADITADIATLADIEDGTDATDAIQTVASISSNVTTVAGISGNVTTVAGNTSNINTVAGDLSGDDDIGTVAGSIANVNLTGGSISNVNTTAGSISNVNTVASNISNVNTVGGISSDVSTVAGVSADVTTVAGIDSDVTTVATNVADVTNFADVYIGPAASDPTTRTDTSALQAGDMYFNTTVDELRVYSGSQWVAGTAGTMAVQRFSGDGSTVAFTLTTAPAGENNTQVYINGVYQQKDGYGVSGTTLTFSAAPPLGTDNIEVVTISTLALGETDASFVTFTQDGTGAVETTVEAKLNETVSVKDFGAVGDGVTDDTTAFTNTDAASSSSDYSINSGTYLFEGENLPNIGNADKSDFATIENSIYSGVVQSDKGVSWLQHNHLEFSDASSPYTAVTSGDIPPAPLFDGAKQSHTNVLAYWYQDFGLEATRAASGGIGGLQWYYWSWLFHGASGDGYEPERHPWLGYYRGDDPNVLDWQCYWLNEAGVTGTILNTRGDGAQFGSIRSTWSSSSDVNHWMYQLLNNVPNFQPMTYALWAWSASNTYDAATRTLIEGSFDEIVDIYNTYDNFNYIEKNGKIYPVVFAFEAGYWRGAYDNYSGDTNMLAFLKAQAVKFQNKGWGGFCLLARNPSGNVIGNQDLEANGVIVFHAPYTDQYDPAKNGGVNPAVDYEDLAIGVSVNMVGAQEARYTVPAISTARYSHSAHPTTWTYDGSTPELFNVMARNCLKRMAASGNPPMMLVYNVSEWAEGGPSLQPNMRDGKGYIYALRDALNATTLQLGDKDYTYLVSDVQTLSAPSIKVTVPEGAQTIPLDVTYAWISTATPFIDDDNPYDGKRLTIKLDSTSSNPGPIQITDETVTAGSGLKLDEPLISLYRNDSITVEYDATLGLWIQVASGLVRPKKQYLDAVSGPTDKLQLNAGVKTITFRVTYSFTSTATPFINPNGDLYDGRRIRVMMDQNSTHGGPITLQDEGTLTGSGLRLTATTISLGRNDSVEFEYDANQGLWIQTSPVVNII